MALRLIEIFLQGVRPRGWWDKAQAMKATKRAMTIWLICLALLVILILTSQRWAG